MQVQTTAGEGERLDDTSVLVGLRHWRPDRALLTTAREVVVSSAWTMAQLRAFLASQAWAKQKKRRRKKKREKREKKRKKEKG